MRESHREPATCIECTRAGQKQAQGYGHKHSYNTHSWALLYAIRTRQDTHKCSHLRLHALTHALTPTLSAVTAQLCHTLSCWERRGRQAYTYARTQLHVCAE